MLTLTIAVFVATIQGLSSLQEDFYWREYTGTIPADALVAGQDIGNKDIYIGQAYVHGDGLIPVEIFPGVREVQVPIKGVQKINSRIKILCGTHKNVVWLPANSTHLHLQLINKRPIIGGHETGGVLYVGRINDEGSTKIGKITAYFPENAKLYYERNGTEKSVNSYEILLYDDNVDVKKDDD